MERIRNVRKGKTREERRKEYYGMDDDALAKSGLRIELSGPVIVLRDREGNSLFDCPIRTLLDRRRMSDLYGWFERRRIMRLLRHASNMVYVRCREED